MSITSTITDGWQGLLDPGERILWQGRPDPGFALSPGAVFIIPFALVFTGFSVFWMGMAAQAGGYFWTFGLIFFGVGIGMLVNAVVGPTFTRRRTWYSLSDRRAFVATDLPIVGRRMKSYPIKAESKLEFRDGALSSLYFAEETRRGNRRSYTVPIGFERIPDGRAVYRLYRDIQQGQARETGT